MKKMFALVLTVLMTLALSIPAFAGDNGLSYSARIIGNGNNARLAITVNDVEHTGFTFNNNTTDVHQAGGFEFAVFVRGGAVQSITLLSDFTVADEAPASIGDATTTPGIDADDVADALEETRVVIRTVSFNHDPILRNRVWPVDADGNVWFSNNGNSTLGVRTQALAYVGNDIWRLISDQFFCPVCGSNEWVSYSNMDGGPAGGNVQLVCVGDGDCCGYLASVGSVMVDFNAVEKYVVETHGPVFAEAYSTRNTLVSQSTSRWNNGHTWVAINVEEARTTGVSIEIADSSDANAPIGLAYNVNIVGNNITVSFNDNVLRANFGFEVQNTPGALAGGPSNINHVLTLSRTLPLPANYGDTVYLFFHNAGGMRWLTDEVIGCVVIDVTEANERAYTGDTVFTVGLYDLEGNEVVVYDTTLGFGYEGILSGVPVGDFVVVLYADGVEIAREYITVEDGDTAAVDFGTIVIRDDVVVVVCDFC